MLTASWHRISRSIINGVGSGPYQGEFVILDSFPLSDFRGKRYLLIREESFWTKEINVGRRLLFGTPQ